MMNLCQEIFSLKNLAVAGAGPVIEHIMFWVLLVFLAVVLSVFAVFLFRYLRLIADPPSSLGQLRLKNVMESSTPVAMAVLDSSGRVVQVNRGFGNMLGYVISDIKGNSVFTFLFDEELLGRLRADFSSESKSPLSDRALLEYIVQRCLTDSEFVFVRRSGEKLRVNLTVHVINNNRGREVGYLIVAGDLTEKNRIRRELDDSRRFLRSVIDAIPMRIFWKSPDSVYLGCNKAFAQDAGLESTNDIVGMRDSQMPWAEPHGEEYVSFDREVMETRQQRSCCQEQRWPIAGGPAMTVRTSKLPLLDVNDKLMGLLGIYEDVTDYIRMQEIVEKRIVSLTRYMDDPDTLEFDKLFNIAEIQKIQDEFSESTNVSSVIVAVNGDFITKSSRMSALCRLVMDLKEDNCAACYKLSSDLVGDNTEGPLYRTCSGSGLSMAVSPIVVNGVHVASWILGQVRIDEKDKDELEHSAAAAGVDFEPYCYAYENVPRMTNEQFESIAQTANTLCAQLSLFATQNLQQARLLKKEKERMEEIRRFEAIIRQIPDGVIIIGKDQKIQYANPAFTTITGYSADEAIGMSPMVLSSEKNSRELLEGIVSTISQGKVWSGRLTNRRKDGAIYTEESVISPFLDESGKIISAVATMRDVTEEIAREEQMYHRQKMAAVGQLAGGVAHDFNNILQAIQGFSEMLLLSLEDGSREYNNAEQICAASKRAAALTRGLLALSRKDAEDETVVQSVDVNFMLRDSFPLFNLLTTDKVEVIYDLDPDLKSVSFSNDKLYQVIVNLITNSRDAMPEGGIITVKTENVTGSSLGSADLDDNSEFVCVSVEDNGTGIPEEIRHKIFNPFYTTKEIGKGSGLGLSIVYVIIEDYGGKITFDSKIGEGTKFSVYLPVEIV